MKYVNKRMTIVINRMVTEITGGHVMSMENLRQGANLGFIDYIHSNSLFGQEIYPDIFHMAGAYMFYVIKDHMFQDGNKRTGLACAMTFLQWNGYTIKEFDHDNVFNFTVGIASGENNPDNVIPKIAEWLKSIVE